MKHSNTSPAFSVHNINASSIDSKPQRAGCARLELRIHTRPSSLTLQQSKASTFPVHRERFRRLSPLRLKLTLTQTWRYGAIAEASRPVLCGFSTDRARSSNRVQMRSCSTVSRLIQAFVAYTLTRSRRRTPTDFLSLPAEIRNRIFTSTLVKKRTQYLCAHVFLRKCRGPVAFVSVPKWAPAWEEPAILRCCKTVRAEGSRLYYFKHDFELFLLGFKEFVQAAAWLSRLMQRCGMNDPCRALDFLVSFPVWVDLEHLRAFVFLITQTGLKFRSRGLTGMRFRGIDYHHLESQVVHSAFRVSNPRDHGPF